MLERLLELLAASAARATSMLPATLRAAMGGELIRRRFVFRINFFRKPSTHLAIMLYFRSRRATKTEYVGSPSGGNV